MSGVRGRLSATPLPWLGGLLVLYLAAPIALFASGLATSHDRGFSGPGLWGALSTSVLTATISAAVIAALGIPLAYVLARARGWLSTVAWVLILLPLAMPPLMSGVLLVRLLGPYTPLGEAFGRHLTGSVAGIVLAQTFVASPFLVATARSAFAAVDPTVVEHAATLGHRQWSRFWRVELPLAWPGVRAGLLLSWLRAFGEFGATVVVAYHPSTLPVLTYVRFSSTGIPQTQAPTALALGAAVLAGCLGRLPHRQRRRRSAAIPPASVPQPTQPVPVSFRFDTRLGGFALGTGHAAASPRLALLGPSGSGKSATLRGIAGLLGVGAGTVRYGDRCVDGTPVEDRRIGYVPQGYGLFPHLTVWQQVNVGVGASPSLAAYWLERLGLGGLEARFTDELSGGQRQRVALAQALARAPELLLLDEPFSALDGPVRHELRSELRRLQRETAISTVLVTHDPDEAAYLADEIVVVQAGRVLQAGTTSEVLGHPASADVARLTGARNLCSGRVATSGTVSAGGILVEAGAAFGLRAGTDVQWCVRPEDVDVLVDGLGHPALVVDSIELGASRELLVRLGPGFELVATVPSGPLLAVGSVCRVTVPPGAVRLWAVPDPDPGPTGAGRPAPVAAALGS